MHSQKAYRTKDLGLAAFLIEQGYKLLRLEPEGRLKLFVFEPEAEGDAAEYFNSGTVKARTYFDTVRALKALCNPR